MTQISTPSTLALLQDASAASPAALLAVLKDLKNSVIGNTWKKVEVSEDEEVLHFLLALLDLPDDASSASDGPAHGTRLELVHETAVIIGALGNVGALTLRPLLLARAPERILYLIRTLPLPLSSDPSGAPTVLVQTQCARALPPLLRALRNVLVCTADVVWGHLWGAGAERRVVDTGLGPGTGLGLEGSGQEMDVDGGVDVDGPGKDAAEEAEDVQGEYGARGKGNGKGKGKGKARDEGRLWKREARRALGLVFEDDNLDTLLALLRYHARTGLSANQQVILPLYQLFSRLIVLPSHRAALARWSPPPSRAGTPSTYASQPEASTSRYAAGSSSNSMADRGFSYARTPFGSTPRANTPTSPPFILSHLLAAIAETSGSGTAHGRMTGARTIPARRNPKLLEAALDLLAVLVKGEAGLAALVRRSNPDRVGFVVGDCDMDMERERSSGLGTPGEGPASQGTQSVPGFMGELVEMMTGGNPGVRIAAAGCLTNIIKADKASKTTDRIRASVMNLQLLDIICKLLGGESYEERIKLCFVLAALVSDDAQLQVAAATKGCPEQIIEMVARVEEEEARGEIGTDSASRSREALLLALAALSFQHEPTRILIAEHEPPFLPFLLKSLSHASYGVRAAACQLARALSRTVSILRTSLVDSGVGEEVIRVLQREVATHESEAEVDAGAEVEVGGEERDVGEDGTDGADQGERARAYLGDEQMWTVEVAALATVCNLVTDFSPLRTKVIAGGNLETLCALARSRHEPLASGAMWALKNLAFHSVDGLKVLIASTLGYAELRSDTLPSIRAQAMGLVQNLLADATIAELARWPDAMGDGDVLLDLVAVGMRDADVDVAIPSYGVLSNLCLGNERMRLSITRRVELVEALSEGWTHKSDRIRIAALQALRHLLESSTRTRRPRAAMIEVFQPYRVRARLEEVCRDATSFDVRNGAERVLGVLDKEAR